MAGYVRVGVERENGGWSQLCACLYIYVVFLCACAACAARGCARWQLRQAFAVRTEEQGVPRQVACRAAGAVVAGNASARSLLLERALQAVLQAAVSAHDRARRRRQLFQK